MLRAGGGYPTTAREQELAEQRERLSECSNDDTECVVITTHY